MCTIRHLSELGIGIGFRVGRVARHFEFGLDRFRGGLLFHAVLGKVYEMKYGELPIRFDYRVLFITSIMWAGLPLVESRVEISGFGYVYLGVLFLVIFCWFRIGVKPK